MGKTKIRTIDDSVQEERPLVRGDAEDGRQDTAAAGPRTEKKTKVSKRAQKKASTSTKVRGKKYQAAAQKVEVNKRYPLNEAVKLTQEVSYTKFPGTIEAHINTNVKNIRGLVSLPYSAGKKLRVLAFGKDAGQSGADLVGTEDTLAEIEKGKMDFDVVVTTPEWMPKLAKVAKKLGPKGLMPSPKNGTITENLAKTVTELQGGKTEYKTENQGQVIHLGIGKTAQAPEEITANIQVLYNTIGKSKITKVTLSPSMGPSVKVDLGSI